MAPQPGRVVPGMPQTTKGPRVSRLQSVWRAIPPLQASFRIRLMRLYNWSIWKLLTVILFAQFFGVIWSSVTTNSHFQWGRSPLMGQYTIPGFNDEPYSDRAVACVKRGHYYRPIQLSQLLAQHAATPVSSSNQFLTNGIDGYRVVSRDSYTIDATQFSFYERQCNTIMLTLENIFHACDALGYNVTRDVLRIVDGVNSSTVRVLEATAPVLIIPYWDYGALARYVVPGYDGNACVFRGSGAFDTQGDVSATLSGVTRSVREKKTEEWLEYPGGVWKNGWYEDPNVNMKWYSDIISSLPHGDFDIGERKFDLMDNGRELDCSKPPYGCGGGISTWSWNEELSMEVDLHWYTSIAVSNGSRFGLFLFDALHIQTITSRYSLEKLISNASIAVLLSHWFVALVALAPSNTIGIGAIANVRSFYLLPIFLLPRMKPALEAFWSSGCEFEGDQRALADAWFEIYPAIGEVVLVYFSLLNMLAKLLRRRVRDALFGPTLLFFAFLHFFRAEIAAANLLEFDKRVSTAITANEVANSTLFDLLFSDVAFRMNGRVKSLYGMKLVVFAINLIPLFIGSRWSPDRGSEDSRLDAEIALAKNFMSHAGLGSTATPYTVCASGKPQTLRPYELVRANYVAVSSRHATKSKSKARCALLSMSDWFWLLVTTPLRRSPGLVLRVTVYELAHQPHGEFLVTRKPRIVTVADSRFDDLNAWKPSAPFIR